jgi:hypothetical protein
VQRAEVVHPYLVPIGPDGSRAPEERYAT